MPLHFLVVQGLYTEMKFERPSRIQVRLEHRLDLWRVTAWLVHTDGSARFCCSPLVGLLHPDVLMCLCAVSLPVSLCRPRRCR